MRQWFDVCFAVVFGMLLFGTIGVMTAETFQKVSFSGEKKASLSGKMVGVITTPNDRFRFLVSVHATSGVSRLCLANKEGSFACPFSGEAAEAAQRALKQNNVSIEPITQENSDKSKAESSAFILRMGEQVRGCVYESGSSDSHRAHERTLVCPYDEEQAQRLSPENNSSAAQH